MQRFVLPLLLLVLLTACGRLDSILYDPPQTPQSWLQIQPYAEFTVGGQRIIFVQPSTSALVYLLGAIAIGVGIYFMKIKGNHRSRLWWGVGLLLWGVGALLAGTSYEAFSYAVKCAERESCLWTSWWEILYLIASVWSIDAMMLAVAHSSTEGKLRKGLSLYAVINAVVYFSLVLIGVFIPNKFLISFEFLLVIAAPTILVFFILHASLYAKHKHATDLIYLVTWLWLGMTIVTYFVYYLSGNTAVLWARGQWFSENDVLHIGLIIWMLFIAFVLAARVEDAPASA